MGEPSPTRILVEDSCGFRMFTLFEKYVFRESSFRKVSTIQSFSHCIFINIRYFFGIEFCTDLFIDLLLKMAPKMAPKIHGNQPVEI